MKLRFMSPPFRPRRSSFVWRILCLMVLQELQDKFFERVWSSIWKRPKGFQSQITLKIGDFIETGRSWWSCQQEARGSLTWRRVRRSRLGRSHFFCLSCDASGDPTQQFLSSEVTTRYSGTQVLLDSSSDTSQTSHKNRRQMDAAMRVKQWNVHAALPGFFMGFMSLRCLIVCFHDSVRTLHFMAFRLVSQPCVRWYSQCKKRFRKYPCALHCET